MISEDHSSFFIASNAYFGFLFDCSLNPKCQVKGRKEEKKPSNPEQRGDPQDECKGITSYPQNHQSHVLTDRDQP
jgi:hypothetical protein